MGSPDDSFVQDYADALSKSFLFYEANRSGADQSPRVPWRQVASTNDGADIGVDLSGGWYDAGDHVKFGLPMSYSAAILAWGGYEFGAAYNDSAQRQYLEDNLRFVSDYFLQAYQDQSTVSVADDILVYQVGNDGPTTISGVRRNS